MSPSAMPATSNEGRCHQVPRLPRKSAAARLPRKTKLDVAKCHVCHVKRRQVSPSAKVVCDKVVGDKVVCDKVVCDKVVCDKVVCDKVVCDKIVYVATLCM